MNSTISILLVEDVKIISDAMRDALATRGYSVTVAHSGLAARVLLDHPNFNFSGLVTDIGLGAGPDGWEVARLARVRNPHMFVLYLTGSAVGPGETPAVHGSLTVRKPVTAAGLMLAVEQLQKKAEAPAEDQSISTREDLIALAEPRDATRLGQADLLASETALARSQAETRHGLAELLASENALASSQAETKVGLVDLLASAAALAMSRAKTKISVADLLARATALAASRAETRTGQSDALGSELANRSFSIANDLLVTNEATLERMVEQRTADLTREIEGRRVAEDARRQGEKLRAIGQLTGGIAHDFNNILQIVISTTASLRSADITNDRRIELLDNLAEAAALGGQATSRLLAFARKKALLPRSCDINLLVQAVDHNQRCRVPG